MKTTYPAHPINSSKVSVVRRLIKFASVAFLLHPMLSYGSTFYWNADDGGSGNWNSTDTAWGTDAAGPPDTAWSSSAGATDIARFAFSGGTVTLQEALGAGGLQFEVDGYTINASSSGTSFQLNGARPIQVNTGATATLGPNVRITGGAATEVGFAKTGGGTLVIQGTEYIGNSAFANRRNFNIDAGTMRVESAAFNNSRHYINISSGATVDMHHDLQLGYLSGSGVLTNTNASMATLGQRETGGVFNGVISGNVALSGSSISATLNIPEFTIGGNDANTFTGNVSVNRIAYVLNKPEGVTALSGHVIFANHHQVNLTTANRPRITLNASEQIADSSNLTFNGQNTGQLKDDMLFQLNGFSERMADLIIGAQSNHSGTLDFGNNAISQYLWFNEFIVDNSDSPPIVITHFVEGDDSLRFDSNPTSNLAWLKFSDGVDLINATSSFDAVNDYWLVTPIPEPASFALLLGLGTLLTLGLRRRQAGK